MSSLAENIKWIILNTLPSLSVEMQIVSMLQTSGVESVDDLKYVQQEDIKGLLPVIQQRQLVEAFRLGNKYLFNHRLLGTFIIKGILIAGGFTSLLQQVKT